MGNFSEAGNHGPSIRSDIYIRIEETTSSGLDINLESKVKSLYGESITALIKRGAEFYGIDNARIDIIDSGALPFVIMARLEAAVKKLRDTDKDFLPQIKEYCCYETRRDRFRRSRLYLPGDQPKIMVNAGLHKPDGIILDLEDSVSVEKKHDARFLVRNALRMVNFMGAERMVRINQGEMGLTDLEYIVPHNLHLVLIPKAESRDDVIAVDEKINMIKRKKGIDRQIFLMPIIESARGVMNSNEIAGASENNVALAIGLEDYTKDIGTERSDDQLESMFALSFVLNAAKAAGLQAIDTVYSDVSDPEGLRKSVHMAKKMGFEGKGCIHPRQIKIIHSAFLPTESEIEKAKAIFLAFKRAESMGLGVVSLGTKMIDPPVVKRALRVINLAIANGILKNDWEKGDEQNG